MIDRKIVGTTYAPFTVEVERRWIRGFAEAIGDADPIRFDEAAARAAGYRSLVAPPTFPFAVAMEADQCFSILRQLGIDQRRAMHAEQSFVYHGDVCAGDVLTGQQTVVDVYPKKNGELEFIVTEIRLDNQRGERVCDMRITVVVRNGAGVNA
jgi:acyl dehydratase